ncbi:MAG: ABC transporter ATP-binding protein [Spirochaetales bacterium]|nr:ABC transporter ATP-binding protein [Spirochaetales bacterium]
MADTAAGAPLLDVRGLKTYFHTEEGLVRAVDDVSFSVSSSEVLGLVGESGCGKSVTAFSILDLIPVPPGRIEGGEILFRGKDLLKTESHERRRISGNHISMIFQEPMTALNPVMMVGSQITEVLKLHTLLDSHDRWEKAIEMIAKVGISEPRKTAKSYPHELSGGMRQRIMIAMALVCDPDILIADEPTTALDVTIQAQILELIKAMQRETSAAVILITHDLAVIAETVNRVIVMYAGKIVESGDVKTIFTEPKHPYTQGLLKSIPVLGEPGKLLESIKGRVPNLIDLPPGCHFANRCPFARERCFEEHPRLVEVDSDEHEVRCNLYYD